MTVVGSGTGLGYVSVFESPEKERQKQIDVTEFVVFGFVPIGQKIVESSIRLFVRKNIRYILKSKLQKRLFIK